ncbi:MAG: hypothetical protein V4506_07790 [Bacteroidota bacterium]
MRQFSLPYRKIINRFFLYFFGIPLIVCIGMYLKGERTEAAMKGILFYVLPAIISLIGFAPFFKFKSDDKGVSEDALLKIPILEFYVLITAGIFSLITFGGLSSIFEGDYKTGGKMLIIGLPASMLILFAINSKRIWFKDQLIPEIVKKELEEKRVDIGMFNYTDKGFVYNGKNKTIAWNWANVSGVIAYKTDNYYYDTIHLILKTDNGEEFYIHEDIAGWFIFKGKLSDNLIGMDKYWELKAMSPPFETSVTLVYEKGKDLMAEWGKEKTGSPQSMNDVG